MAIGASSHRYTNGGRSKASGIDWQYISAANRSRTLSSRVSTGGCATSSRTRRCSPMEDARIRASTGSRRASLQGGPTWTITRTDSPYERVPIVGRARTYKRKVSSRLARWDSCVTIARRICVRPRGSPSPATRHQFARAAHGES
jgi:hypothetical protein